MRSPTLVAFLLLAGSACADSASADAVSDCDRLRDHAVDLSLATAVEHGGAELPDDVRAAHREQLRAAVAGTYETRCASLRRAELDCGLAATTAAELAACTAGAR